MLTDARTQHDAVQNSVYFEVGVCCRLLMIVRFQYFSLFIDNTIYSFDSVS